MIRVNRPQVFFPAQNPPYKGGTPYIFPFKTSEYGVRWAYPRKEF
jgi:hypothetical protein